MWMLVDSSALYANITSKRRDNDFQLSSITLCEIAILIKNRVLGGEKKTKKKPFPNHC